MDLDTSTNLEEPVPVLNPTWQEALDKVMHTSLMSNNTIATTESTQTMIPHDEEGLSDIEEGLEVDADPQARPYSTFPDDDQDQDSNKDREDDHYERDDAFLSDDEDDSSVKVNHQRDQLLPSPQEPPDRHSRSPSPSPSQSPSAPSHHTQTRRRMTKDPTAVPSPVVHLPRDPKVEATKKRIQENLALQKEETYELLGRLQYLIDEKGFKPFRVLGPDDSLEDIRYEVFRANREMTKKRNVKMMQKALVTVGAGVEMMNSWYNPLNLRLDGFSKSLLLSIREYDEVLEELHWKYCDAVAMPPEMKLIMTLGSSMWFFHISNHSTIPSTTSDAPSARPPATTTEVPQRKMNGPRTSSSTTNSGPSRGSDPASLDMTTLMSGLGMVQSLMQTRNN